MVIGRVEQVGLAVLFNPADLYFDASIKNLQSEAGADVKML